MKKSFKFLLLLVFIVKISVNLHSQNSYYVNVADYVMQNTGDVAKAIQKAIDENPNRVIFFPDGEYKISSPILTPADPKKSVCLELSNFAVISPVGDWKNKGALIQLGGKDPFNTIVVAGSNYYLKGGILDCKGISDGVSINSGRETVIQQTAIKNAVIGLHIKHGANSGSSDADISGINITGNNAANSIGILMEGHDNTLTNIRIYRCQTGVMINSGGNIFRNIHALYGSGDDKLFPEGCAFVVKRGDNWFDFCYSDQYATGFFVQSGSNVFHDCFSYWYSNRGEKHTAFKSSGPFNSTVTNFTMGVSKNNAAKENIILEEINAKTKGTGIFQNLRIKTPSLITSDSHSRYLSRP